MSGAEHQTQEHSGLVITSISVSLAWPWGTVIFTRACMIVLVLPPTDALPAARAALWGLNGS